MIDGRYLPTDSVSRHTVTTALVAATLAGVTVGGIALAAGAPYWASHHWAAVPATISPAFLAAAAVVFYFSRTTRSTGMLFHAAAVTGACQWVIVHNTGWLPVIGAYCVSAQYWFLIAAILKSGHQAFHSTTERRWLVLAAATLIIGQTLALMATTPDRLGYSATTNWFTTPTLTPYSSLIITGVHAAILLLAGSFAPILNRNRFRVRRPDRALVTIGVITCSITIIAVTVAQTLWHLPGANLDRLVNLRLAQSSATLLLTATIIVLILSERWRHRTIAGNMLRQISEHTHEAVRDQLRTELSLPDLELWVAAGHRYINSQNKIATEREIAQLRAADPTRVLAISTKADYLEAAPTAGHTSANSAASSTAATLRPFQDSDDPTDNSLLAICDTRGPISTSQTTLDEAFSSIRPVLLLVQHQYDRLERERVVTRKLLKAEHAGRETLGRDIHDGVQQTLIALKFELTRLKQFTNPTDIADQQNQCLDLCNRAIGELRHVTRGIDPPQLANLGLAGALGELTGSMRDPHVVLNIPAVRWHRQVELTIYYCVREAITNAHKHSGASQITVTITPEHSLLTATVSDDGVGGAQIEKIGGLAGIRERIHALGGTFTLHSPRGAGTTITLTIDIFDTV